MGFALLIAMGILSLSGTARAQSRLFDAAKSLLGFEEEKPEVVYRERPPLVVPPKLALRPPQPAKGENAANWPNDPDLARARAAEAERRKPVPVYNVNPPSDRLSADEMRAGRRAGAGIPTQPVPAQGVNPNARENNWLSPETMNEANAAGQRAQDPLLANREEPPRRWLTDPPKGVRKPAPGAPVVTGPRRAEPVQERVGPTPLDVLQKPKTSDD
jgi:hypothetical protein